MNSEFLKTFVTVVEQGSMAEAARRMDITPAAVAQQMQALERDLGVRLFARVGRSVHATEAGNRVLDHVKGLLRDVADLHTLANDQSLTGELRLGAGTNALYGIVPGVMAALVQRYPLITVHIQPSYSATMHQDVYEGSLDAALVLEAPFTLSKRCNWQLLREEPFILLAPERFADSDPHELLATQPFIRYDHPWGGQQIDLYLRRAALSPRERCEINSLNAIAVMVHHELGVSIVPEWIEPWPQGLRLARIALPLPIAPRRIGLIWSRASKRLRLVEAFREEAVRLHGPRSSDVVGQVSNGAD